MKNSPPETLSAEARKWWRKIVEGYAIDDDAGHLILQTALEAFDRLQQAKRHITKHGATFTDRFGQMRPNPSITIERDARAGMLAALKALNLDLEPLNARPGRPSGSR